MSPKRQAKFVLDASVALKWQLNDEECVSQAVALRDDALKHSAEICVPTLWLYEIINGLVMTSRRGRFPPREISHAITDFLAMGISIRVPDPQRVSTLALAYGITAYDSAYLALAEQEGCDLWTGDLSLYRAVNKKLRWVRWIGDYTSIS